MLFSLIEGLENIDLVLASTSPRRYELLKTLGLEFKVVSGKVEEQPITGNPIAGAKKNAELKGVVVAKKYPDALVISADTIVVLGKSVMGKPENEQDAYNMLSKLSGRTHQVCTAFGMILDKYGKAFFDSEITDVTFRTLSEAEILAYINTGEPFDKAGGYAVQGQGSVLIEKINGCYFNVVGFPLSRFYVRLGEFLSNYVL